MSLFDSFLEVAGNLGFLVGNNDRRRAQERREKRVWGADQDGFALSLTPSSSDPGPDESLHVEIALRNTGPTSRDLQIGSWLTFFQLEIKKPDGTDAALSSFGEGQFEGAKAVPSRLVTLAPGETLQADLPIGVLYQLKQPGAYTLRGTAVGISAVSNQVQIRI